MEPPTRVMGREDSFNVPRPRVSRGSSGCRINSPGTYILTPLSEFAGRSDISIAYASPPPQDVISYVIARTLGIVDDVKASTSDATGDATMSPSAPTPILMQDSPPAAGGVDVSGDPSFADGVAEDQHRDHIHGNEGDELYTHHAHDKHRPQAFFTGEEDLQLAGVGVFSPAASQPPSPELARIKLTMFDGLESVKKISEERDGALLRQRPRQY